MIGKESSVLCLWDSLILLQNRMPEAEQERVPASPKSSVPNECQPSQSCIKAMIRARKPFIVCQITLSASHACRSSLMSLR